MELGLKPIRVNRLRGLTRLKSSSIGLSRRGSAVEITVTLITGRTAEQGVGKEIGKTSERYQRSTNYVLLNPGDAESIGVEEGSAVEVSTPYGSTRVWCKLSEAVERGMAFIPLGPWANRLFDPETHGTGIPSLKGVEAKIRRAEREPPTLEELLKELKR